MSDQTPIEQEEKETPKVGRPSLYKPEYCQKLIEHMTEGHSYDSFAALIDVHVDTLYEWEKVHSEFSEAKKHAFAKNLLFWEKHGIEGLYSTTEYNDKGKPTSSKSINATVWIFNMKNRHKWRDKQPEEVDQVTVNNNTLNVSDEELETKINKLLESKK